jgi:class 3 adenylate cyclase
MKVLVFSRTPSAFAHLGSLKGKKALRVEVLPIEGVQDVLSSGGEALVYLDLRGLGDKERKKTLSLVEKHPDVCFGIVDPAGAVTDVAALFHAGAVDYIGKKLGPGSLTARRLSKVMEYSRSIDQASDALDVSDDMPEPMSAAGPDGWGDIVAGREYRFAFLFIEADDAEELKKRYEPANLASAMETFRGFMDRMVTKHGGRLWMWSRFGGLALFPLGSGTCLAPHCALRILLSRIFYDVEESLLPGRLSFRMALSVGTTVYQTSNTGGIVSDGINSIFHLGQRFAQPGQFLITEEVFELSPQALRAHALPVGTYEGRRIMRLLQPIPSLGNRENDPACET